MPFCEQSCDVHGEFQPGIKTHVRRTNDGMERNEQPTYSSNTCSGRQRWTINKERASVCLRASQCVCVWLHGALLCRLRARDNNSSSSSGIKEKENEYNFLLYNGRHQHPSIVRCADIGCLRTFHQTFIYSSSIYLVNNSSTSLDILIDCHDRLQLEFTMAVPCSCCCF